MLQLEDRIALVTGGAQGIGAATALRLADGGADVAVVDVNGGGAEVTADRIRQLGRKAVALECDVAVREQVEDAVGKTVKQFGRLDILVNNAGVTRDNLLFRMTDEDWDTVLAIHLRGTFLCTRAAQEHMVANRFGKIVNLSSSAVAGTRGQANYAAAKAGILGFTRTLAIELGPFGINVNAVAPGFIDTEMTRATARRLGHDPEEYMKIRAEAVPLKRVGQPRDIANAVCFLCSEEASFITGQCLFVRGAPGPLG